MHFCILLDHLLGTTPLLSVLSSGNNHVFVSHSFISQHYFQVIKLTCSSESFCRYLLTHYRMLLSKYSMWLTSAVCFELFLELYFLYTDRESQKLRLQMKVLTLLGIQLVHLRRLKLLPKQTEG
ncbi:uncharacterized protein LOC131662511 isoform X2 [Vicia villosa]|uniref:uncharacterized protein LOC131662511 isoform X2 n=1 Tax=Vicia villosa TaxID=3911 RepID=UPI00273A8196|nr:uncharacterized protein LOC131662511 isoform X2 [Vicia villosa]